MKNWFKENFDLMVDRMWDRSFGFGFNFFMHEHMHTSSMSKEDRSTGEEWPWHCHLLINFAFWFVELRIGRDYKE